MDTGDFGLTSIDGVENRTMSNALGSLSASLERMSIGERAGSMYGHALQRLQSLDVDYSRAMEESAALELRPSGTAIAGTLSSSSASSSSVADGGGGGGGGDYDGDYAHGVPSARAGTAAAAAATAAASTSMSGSRRNFDSIDVAPIMHNAKKEAGFMKETEDVSYLDDQLPQQQQQQQQQHIQQQQQQQQQHIQKQNQEEQPRQRQNPFQYHHQYHQLHHDHQNRQQRHHGQQPHQQALNPSEQQKLLEALSRAQMQRRKELEAFQKLYREVYRGEKAPMPRTQASQPMAGFPVPSSRLYGQQQLPPTQRAGHSMLPHNARRRQEGFQQQQPQHQQKQHVRQQHRHELQQFQEEQWQLKQQQEQDTSWDQIGTLTAAERAKKIEKFRAKRGKRNFVRKVKYRGREALANSRVRIKGRFVPKEVQNAYLELQKKHPEWNFNQLSKAVLEHEEEAEDGEEDEDEDEVLV